MKDKSQEHESLFASERFPLLVCENGHRWRTALSSSFVGRPCSDCGKPLVRKCPTCSGDLVRTTAGRLICGGECPNV